MNSYKVIVKGVSKGMQPENVLDSLEKLFKVSRDQIRPKLESGNFIVKTSVDEATAQRYLVTLEKIGCIVVVEAEARVEHRIETDNTTANRPVDRNATKTDTNTKPESISEKRASPSLASASNLITNKLGLDKIEGFSLKHFFSEVFSKHDPDDLERKLSIGSPDTTPPLHQSMGVMPNPWIFFRILSGSIFTYMVFLIAWHTYHNANLIPGLIIIGSFAVPFSVLILFFELNTPKNISLIRIVQLVVFGGAISLFFSLILFQLTPFLGVFGDSAAGIVEEVGKLAALLFALRAIKIDRYKYRLNALLLGAAVGTGFAAFESAGFAFRLGLSQGPDAMLDNITVRGAMSPFAHIAWSAIAASAYWIARPIYSDAWCTIKSAEFWKIFSIPVTLHFIWNLDLPGPQMIKFIALGFVAWVVIFSLVHAGLNEISKSIDQGAR